MLIILVCMKNIEYVQVAGGVRNEQQIMMSGFPVGKGFHKNKTIIHVSQMQIESRVSQFENECCCYLVCQWFCVQNTLDLQLGNCKHTECMPQQYSSSVCITYYWDHVVLHRFRSNLQVWRDIWPETKPNIHWRCNWRCVAHSLNDVFVFVCTICLNFAQLPNLVKSQN